MTAVTPFRATLSHYPIDQAAQLLTAAGIPCTVDILTGMWELGKVELCFLLPRWCIGEVTGQGVKARTDEEPGEAELRAVPPKVLLAVDPGGFMPLMDEHNDPTPGDPVTLRVRAPGSQDEWVSRNLRVDWDYRVNSTDTYWRRRSETFGRQALVITGDELEHIWQTCFPDARPSASPKTVNYLAKVVKSLICIQYGKDVAENPRTPLEPGGDIYDDFIKKKLKPPSGKHLAQYLARVELD